MSPAYREPPQRDGNDAERSVWTTTGIYIALIVLTIMMAIGLNSISGSSSAVAPETSASRGP